ncbi:MAG: hypothetical protein IJG64_01685 [Oscillospiraceae bacterium]|nr:hypothetical protein [Oscillospiraceae bacterium]
MSGKHVNHRQLVKENRKRRKKRKVISGLLIALVTLILVYFTGIYGTSLAYFGDFLSSGMTLVQFGKGWPVEKDMTGLRQAEKMGTGLAVLTDDQMLVYSPTAKQVMAYSHSMSNPAIAVSSTRAVLYDLDETTFKVMNGHNMLFQQEMDNSIIHIAISNSNRIAVTTHSSTHNGEVTVFNYNMNRRFTWYCAKGYPIYSRISSNGKRLAVSTVNTRGGLLESSIYILDGAENKELYSIDSGSFPMYMTFLKDRELLIGYSGKIVLWDIDGNTQKAEYSLNGYLQAIDYHNQTVALVVGSMDENRPATLILLDSSLNQKGTARLNEGAKDILINKSRVYVLGINTLYEFDKDLNLMSTTGTGRLTRKLADFRGVKLIDSTGIKKVERTDKKD